MITILRLLRAGCGLYMILVVFALLLLVTQFRSMPVDGLPSVSILVAILLVLGGFFAGLRSLINRLHERQYGCRHPTLGERTWAL